ncbi:MAG TPA: protein kinase [Tepidisphaeraceae bacterium]
MMFTDLVNSSITKAQIGAGPYAELVARQDRIVHQTVSETPGARVMQDTGDGFFITFETVGEAIAAALKFQFRMRAEAWPHPMAARVGIHLGQVAQVASETTGQPKVFASSVDLAARVMSLAAGGQILLTRTVFDEARQFVHEHPPVDGHKPAIRWVAHGPYLFKGSDEPMEIYEVGAEGVAPLAPPEDNEKARRHIRPGEEQTLGWRPGANRPLPNAAHWVIRRKLGEGGFGEVWLATHRKTHANRVFKFCFDAERLRALKREVVLFRLIKEALGDRRDIGRVVDWQFESAPYFIEMDYAPEGNLSHWAESQGGIQNVKVRTRLRIVAQVAEALAAAHSVGILHKDIKPSNVLMVRDAEGALYPRLSDFGIGTLTDRSKLRDFNISATGFTQSSLSLADTSRSGTLMYTPPESLANKPHTVQGDVYALGVLLNQMVVADLHKPLAPGWERSVADELLREDIAACVDGDPANRLQSAQELADRLTRLDERRQERVERDQARQRDEETRRVAAEAARVAERRKRVITVLTAGVAVLGVIAALFSVLLWQLSDRTREAQTNANARAEEARRAKEAGEEASKLGVLAREAAARAQVAEAVKRRALSAELVAHGLEKWSTGSNPAMALPYFVRALDEVEGKDPLAASAHRSRIGATLAHCLVPCFGVPRAGAPLPISPEPGVVAQDGRVLRRRDGDGLVWVIEDPTDRAPLTFHTGARITSACFSPDGERLVTCGADGKAILWDARNGRRVGKPMPHDAAVRFACFNADGSRVVTGGEGRAARVWDARSGEPVTDWLPHHAAVTCGVFSPDGSSVVTGGNDNLAIAWDLATAKPIGEAMTHPRPITGLVFCPSSRLQEQSRRDARTTGITLATLCEDHAVRLWNAATGKPIGEALRHQGPVNSVVFSEDGSQLVTASDDRSARVWDAATGAAVGKPLEHVDHVLHAAFDRPARRIVTACRDGTVRLWHAETGEPIGPRIQHRAAVRGAVFSPDGKRLVTLLHDWALFVWNLPADENASPMTQPGFDLPNIETAAFDPDGARLIVVSGGQPVIRDPADPNAPPLRLVGHSGRVTAVAMGKGGLAVTGGADHKVICWDATTGQMRSGSPLMLDDDVRLLSISDDATRVAASTRKNTAWVWDVKIGITIASGVRPANGGRIAAFSPDASRVIAVAPSGPQGESAVVYDLASGKLIGQPMTHADHINHVEFSSDGQRIVTASKDFTARVWSVAGSAAGVTDRPLRHTGPVLWASFSPDGQRVVTASYDHTARVWDTRTGAALTPQMGHERSEAEVRWAGFSPDGALVGTATNFFVARIWDAQSGQAVTPWLPHAKVITQMAFGSDSRRVLTIGEDRRLRVWNIAPDPRPVEDLRKLAKLLSGRSLDQSGGEMPLRPDEFNALWRELATKYPSEFSSRGAVIAPHVQAGLWRGILSAPQ